MKKHPKKNLCEASRTLNMYLRIAELYFSILDSKDMINISSQIRREHVEGKCGTFVSFYPSPSWLGDSAGAWVASLVHLGNSKWTKPQVISSGSCRTLRGGFQRTSVLPGDRIILVLDQDETGMQCIPQIFPMRTCVYSLQFCCTKHQLQWFVQD